MCCIVRLHEPASRCTLNLAFHTLCNAMHCLWQCWWTSVAQSTAFLVWHEPDYLHTGYIGKLDTVLVVYCCLSPCVCLRNNLKTTGKKLIKFDGHVMVNSVKAWGLVTFDLETWRWGLFSYFFQFRLATLFLMWWYICGIFWPWSVNASRSLSQSQTKQQQNQLAGLCSSSDSGTT